MRTSRNPLTASFAGLLLLGTGLFLPESLLAEPAAPPSPQSPPLVEETAQVVWHGTPLFSVVGIPPALPAVERAMLVAGRLDQAFSRSRDFRCSAEEVEGTFEVICGGTTIVRLTDRDAAAAGTTRKLLAEDLSTKINGAAARERNADSVAENVWGAVKTLAVTAVFLLLLLAFSRGRRFLTVRVERFLETVVPSTATSLIRFLKPHSLVGTLPAVFKWIHTFAVVVCLYFYIPLVLGFFPYTKSYADSAVQVMIEPFSGIGRGILEYIPKLLFLFALVVVTRYSLKMVRRIFKEVGEGTITIPGFFPDWSYPTYQIVRFLTLAFAVVVAFPYLPGAETEAFRAVGIFLGVLFSMGSSSAVSNVVSGVMLTYMRAFSVGDRVKISDTVGDVLGKSLLVTRLRTIKNVDVTIPNSLILGSHIVNYSSYKGMLILNTGVTIGYDAPWRKVHELLIEAAEKTEAILPSPKPFVLQTALNDFYVGYEINAYTDQPNRMATTYSELHQNIQDTFNAAGVEIMSQHYLGLRDGNAVTIPGSQRPEGYAAPPFVVEIKDKGSI